MYSAEYHDMCRHAPLQSHSDHPPVLITVTRVITVIITVIVTRLMRVICDRREEED